jgi:hypothetical protein
VNLRTARLDEMLSEVGGAYSIAWESHYINNR